MQEKQEPGWKPVWEGQPRLHGSGVRDSDEGGGALRSQLSEGVRSLGECRSETRVESFRRRWLPSGREVPTLPTQVLGLCVHAGSVVSGSVIPWFQPARLLCP